MQAQADLDRFTADTLYFDQHRHELLKQYSEKWVAIYNQEVVAVARDLQRLERKRITPGHVYREYLTDKEDLLILYSACP